MELLIDRVKYTIILYYSSWYYITLSTISYYII